MRVFIWSGLFFSFSSFAQSLDEARVEFDRYEYAKSAQIYESVLQSKKLNTDDQYKMVFALYMSADWQKCLSLIQTLEMDKSSLPMHELMKADALKALGRYDEAKTAYERYQTLDKEDDASIDIQSCDYLKQLMPIEKMTVTALESNTPKADASYLDPKLGVVFFKELGLDSVRSNVSIDAVYQAELMFMKPFVSVNGEWNQIQFPKNFAETSISSVSVSTQNNKVIFTVVDLLASNTEKHAPHLYIGDLDLASMTVSNVSPWKFAGFGEGRSSAFGVFVPGKLDIVFSQIDPAGNGFSDLYLASWDGSDWTSPRALTEINSPGEDVYPIFHDGYLSFSSTGRLGYGALDVYRARFDKENNKLDTVEHMLAPINTVHDDFWLDRKADTMQVSSNRIGSNGEDDVWKLVDVAHLEELARLEEERKQKERERALEEIVAWIPPKIYFDFKTDKPNSDYSFLDKLAKILAENPTLHVHVEGYADVRGTEEFNNYISLMRAKFVMKELIARGIPKEQIFATGKGENAANNYTTDKSSEEQHQDFRYVSIILEINE